MNFIVVTVFSIFLTISNSYAESYLNYVERTNSQKHVVTKGETLTSILEKYGYKDIFKPHGALEKLLWKNGITKQNENNVEPGTIILLPYRQENVERSIASISTTEETYLNYVERINRQKHVVTKGETLSTILEKYGYKNIFRIQGSLQKLIWKNGIKKQNEDIIEPGMIVLLPYRDLERSIASVNSTIKTDIKKSKVLAHPWSFSLKLHYQLIFHRIN